MRFRTVLCISSACLSGIAFSQGKYASTVDPIKGAGLSELGAYRLLTDLTTNVGNRIAGSTNADKAVQWGKATMERLGLQNVRLVPCMVPHWVRGDHESLRMTDSDGHETPLTCTALGGSIGTPAEGLSAEVIEVHSLDDAAKLGDRAKGKILFFNRPFDASLTNTFAAYGGAVDQRFGGAVAAAKVGAVGAIVRSMTLDPDDVPHTGAMGYVDGVSKVPTAALSIVAANKLSDALTHGDVHVRLELSCQSLPDVPSASVIGEIVGSEKPDDIIVVSGHLDSWDKGTGAHDDGAGVTQSLEAVRLIKELAWKPKRTIRVVLWMNEEHGASGARAYANFAKLSGQNNMAAIESDSGGFAPRGIGTSLKGKQASKLNKWLPAFSTFEVGSIEASGETGTDVEKLESLGTALFGLEVESERYFDYHHSDKDTLDKVNPRELELGALSLATLAWLISEEGI